MLKNVSFKLQYYALLCTFTRHFLYILVMWNVAKRIHTFQCVWGGGIRHTQNLGGYSLSYPKVGETHLRTPRDIFGTFPNPNFLNEAHT